jgi:hypothetical protein
MFNLLDLSSNLLNSLNNKKESFDISSNFIDNVNTFFTPYKLALAGLFIILIGIYIMISSNMIGFSKTNIYIHLIYSLILIYIFLLLIT